MINSMFRLCLILLMLVTQDCTTQENSDGIYRGKYIGDLNTYANQVAGEVYAVDDWTLLMVNFFYNGEGKDTYFWAGDHGRSGPQGFFVPDEYGTTNILERYNGTSSFALTLPEGKRVSRIKWLSVFDIASGNVYGDVYVPDGFEAPAPRSVSALAGSEPSAAVSSEPVRVLDSKTLLIPSFRYDGGGGGGGGGDGGEVYFMTGAGAQPSPRGRRVPDERGYLEPLRSYGGEDVRLELPGALTVFAVGWVSVFDASANRSLAHVALPDDLNVPASLRNTIPLKSSLPHCAQLHRDLQVAWEVFGPQITIQLTAQIGEDDYMSFGISGSEERAQMVGADVTVAWYDAAQQRGVATDYNVSDATPCVRVLQEWRGVCRDTALAGLDSNQAAGGWRRDGLTSVTYRRTLQPAEEMDRAYLPASGATDAVLSAVWALGARGADDAPGHHRAHAGAAHRVALRLADPEAHPPSDCFPFTSGGADTTSVAGWERGVLRDPAQRVFWFRVGPAGGPRGLAARRRAAPALAWYVDGLLAPDIYLRRGLTYTFKVAGGAEPHVPRQYHPLVVSVGDVGALDALSEQQQRAARVLAGAHWTRRARLTPSAAGGLCWAEPTRPPRLDDQFATFRAYNRSLRWSCAGAPADMHLTPNSSWPDLVYYNSFTHPGMGGRIFVVDKFQSTQVRRARGAGVGAAGRGAGSRSGVCYALLVALSLYCMSRSS